MRHWLTALLIAPLMGPVPALADLAVSFRDGAPKDRFVIANTADCPTLPVTLVLDMRPSAGKVIFDVTGAGAGVQVFQPLEVVAGAEYLGTLPEVRDGQTVLELPLGVLPAGAEVVFTIDVDDTVGTREITVNGSEMAGAVISAEGRSGVFDSDARAVLPMAGCNA